MSVRKDGTKTGNPLLGLRLLQTTLDRIDAYAAEIGKPRQEAARNLIQMGLNAWRPPEVTAINNAPVTPAAPKPKRTPQGGTASVATPLSATPVILAPEVSATQVISSPDEAHRPIPGPRTRFPFR